MAEPIVEAPLLPTPEALVNIAIERLQAQFPNWQPSPADPEYRMFTAFAAVCAEVLILAFDIPEAIIQFVGRIVYNTPLREATFATGRVKVKASDTLGHEIEEGDIFLITPEGEEALGYQALGSAVIGTGQTEVELEVQALEPGAESTITGACTARDGENLQWVELVTVVHNPANGSEAESLEEYTARILELARLIAPRPILPEDFANFVRLLVTKEKVSKAVAIDLLELETENGHTKINGSGEGTVSASNVERCVTVIAVNEEGKHLSTAAREEAEELLKNARESTFKSFVAGPTISPITIVVTGKFFKGFTSAGVAAEIEAALSGFFTGWGSPRSGDSKRWVNKTTLRRQDIIRVVDSCTGFNYYTNLKINGTEVEEYTLTGIAPLPELAAPTITLTEGPE